MNSFTFIAFAIGMVCALAQDGAGTPVTCSEVLTVSDCTEVSSGSSLYTDLVCGLDEAIDGCNTENCCGFIISPCSDFVSGDGVCDNQNNNALCSYDGGDCCECTCDDAFICGVDGFDCRDPNACDDAADEDFTDDYGLGGGDAGDTCVPDFIGDGDCDEDNNNAACGFDGGDCCDCICDESTCEASGSDCRDPNACDDDAEEDFTDDYDAGDTCVPDFIGDGDCDEDNNNAACGFDGGDCCDCICDESTCEASGSDCRDPNACGSNDGDDGELAMGPCDTPCLENCDLDWICTS